MTTEKGDAESWHDVTSVRAETVTFTTTLRYAGDGTQEVDTDTLRFRDETSLRRTLADAGFEVVRVDGDWDGTPATHESAELIVTAQRPAA